LILFSFEKKKKNHQLFQRPSSVHQITFPPSSLTVFDDDDDDETLHLHLSNISFTWSKEKLTEIFLRKYGITFDVEVIYNKYDSKGFDFVRFLSNKDTLEVKQ